MNKSTVNSWVKMCKRLLYLITIFHLIFAANSLASITWDGGGSDDLWDTTANWVGDTEPTSSDEAVLSGTYTALVDSSVTAVCKANWGPGWNAGSNSTLNITGGSLTATGGNSYIGYNSTATGTVNLSGGTWTTSTVLIGTYGTAALNVTGGTASSTNFYIAYYSGSVGDVQLDDGLVTVSGTFNMDNSGSGTASMDITGGTLEINGDVTSTIATYVSNGWITGNGGYGYINNTYSGGKTMVTAYNNAWDNGGSGNLWSTAGNWTVGVVPNSNKNAEIDVGGRCLIDSSVTATCSRLFDADDANFVIDITGGSLTVENNSFVGHRTNNVSEVNMTGGTWTSTSYIMIGCSGDGTLDVSGGEVNTPALYVGYNAGSDGHVQLDGGTIKLSSTLYMNSNGGTSASMDITGGTLIINGDHTVKIESYIANGLITAYDGARAVDVDYDTTNSGKTTVTAGSTFGTAGTPPFYVATTGDDDNAGTIGSPFKTIEKARDEVRLYIAQTGLSANLNVYLRAGTYYITDPLIFGKLDSGTLSYSVTYQPYNSESVTISGGERITGWTYTGANNKYTVTISDVNSGDWWFRQLWRDNNRCQRSRWPNPGTYADVSSVSGNYKTLTMNQALSGSNPSSNDTELVMYYQWMIARAKISSISGTQVTTSNVCGTDWWYVAKPEAGCKSHFEHNPDYIDQDNEWHLNRSTGVLTYKAPSGIDPNTVTMIAPRLERMIIIEGYGNNLVTNLHFKNIAIRHMKWNLPSGGYCGMQAGTYYVSAQGNANLAYIVPPAIGITWADGCSFDSCTIANTGGSGICIGKGTKNCVVKDSEFDDVGGSGVMNGWRGNHIDTKMANYDDADAPYENTIKDNNIHDCASEWFGCIGIYDAHAKYTDILYNTISSLPWAGIHAGFKWNQNSYAQAGVLIQENHIYDVMNILHDAGGIYINGNHNGGVLSGNHIHDVNGGIYSSKSWLNNCIMHDTGTLNLYEEDQILYDSDGNNIRFNNVTPSDLSWGFNNTGNIMLAWWMFDENTGSTAYDFTGHDRDGTITGASWVTGKVSKALDFEGSDYITVPNSAISSLDKEITIAFWQYGDTSLQPQADYIFYATKSGRRALSCHLPWSDGTVYWDAGDDGSTYDRISKAASTADYEGTWNHWAFTKNATTGNMKIYLNGSQWHSGTSKTKSMSGIDSSLYIGSAGAGGYYDGIIDDFRVFGEELSADEIRRIYLNGALRGSWRLDTNSGTTAYDSSRNSYDATITGAAWISGKRQNALDFEGADSVTIPNSAVSSLNNEVTISLWQYGDAALQPQNDYIFYASDSAGKVLSCHLPWSDGNVYFDAGNDGNGSYDRIYKAANTADYEGQWNHWAFTKNASTGNMKIYLNGTLWHSGTGKTKTMDNITSVFYLGSGAGGGNYDGIIDEVQIYDRELTATEIDFIYDNGND